MAHASCRVEYPSLTDSDSDSDLYWENEAILSEKFKSMVSLRNPFGRKRPNPPTSLTIMEKSPRRPRQQQESTSKQKIDLIFNNWSTQDRHQLRREPSPPKKFTTTAADLPEHAPILSPCQLPFDMKMNMNVWEIVYSIMREECLRASVDGGVTPNYIPMHLVTNEYQRRARKMFSNEFVRRACGDGHTVKSVKDFFVFNPWIVHKIDKKDKSLWLKLRNPRRPKKKE